MSTPTNNDLDRTASTLANWVVDIRRRLHKIPELRYEEVKTSAFIKETLTQLGVSYTENWGKRKLDGENNESTKGTGVVAEIGTGKSPCVALRADIDGLPIQEETGLEFASEVNGRMHACGHDAHMAMLLGAAAILKKHEATLPGTVRLIFQPAEEGGLGAKAMVEEGVLTKEPRVERITGLHVYPSLPVKVVASRAGGFMAGASFFNIKVVGKGGHGSLPAETIDPVAAGVAIASGMFCLAAREIDALQPSGTGVVSVTSFQAGSACNVIPDEAVLRGTLRALSVEKLKYLETRVVEIAEGTACVHRCKAFVTFEVGATPPTENDPQLWEFVKETIRSADAESDVRDINPVAPSEDFSFYGNHVPATFFFLGVGPTAPLHNSKMNLNEKALPYGAFLHSVIGMRGVESLVK